MTDRKRIDDPFRRAREAFKAHLAGHHPAVQRAMGAHLRAIERMERRIAEAMNPHRRAIEAIELRMSGRKRRPGGDGPPGRPKRRDEGGEPAPVKPSPKPRPLAGAAAAPIE